MSSLRRLIDVFTLHPEETELVNGWTGARILDWTDRQIRTLGKYGNLSGELIGLPLANDVTGFLCLVLLLRVGASVLILPEDIGENERSRILEMHGATRFLTFDDAPSLVGPALRHGSVEPSVHLLTSGSTGAPKVVIRSEASLIEEGQRYLWGLALTRQMKVALLAPIGHAYSLGWLFGTLMAGARTTLIMPTHFNQVFAAIESGVDWLVITPTIARLLARRPLPGGIAPPFEGLNVMVGAGPVYDGLETAFQERFGVGLARNYGSTETGALFFGPAGLPSGAVGSPLPGVEYRIVDDLGSQCAIGCLGDLEINIGNGWHSMGDIVVLDDESHLIVKGRRSESIRRGDRWISPRDIEEATMTIPGIMAAHTVKALGHRNGGEDESTLHVWPLDPLSFDQTVFRTELKARLSAFKQPDYIQVRGALDRSGSGKVAQSPRYKATGSENLLMAARAYKRSELLFALFETGVLLLLDGTRSVEDIAEETGIDLCALDILLEQARRLGLVFPDGDTAGGSDVSAIASIVNLETILSRTVVTREQFTRLLHDGVHMRGLDDPEVKVVKAAYGQAMHGRTTAFRVRLGLRLAALPPGGRILEITTGPGDYLVAARSMDPNITGRLWQVGSLAFGTADDLCNALDQGQLGQGPSNPEETFDLIVLFNSVRWPPIPSILADFMAKLTDGGLLLVDDLFLGDDSTSGEYGLDWISHGGISFRKLQVLVEFLSGVSGSVDVHDVQGSQHAKHVVARMTPHTDHQ